MNSPKTLTCCGVKPIRIFYQTGFRDDEGTVELKCPKCGFKVKHENQYRGTQKCYDEATILWNLGANLVDK